MSAIEQKVRLAAAPLKVALDRLRRRGMVRAQSDRDRFHEASFELTEDGREAITRIYARHTEDIEAVMSVLSPRERRPLWQALRKIGLQGERCQHTRSKDRRGGLAPWQLRRATEYMTEHLAGPVLLKDVAGQTGLSPSRFGRAFKLSMGISPHRWRMNQRVLEAQEMLRDGTRSQADIALATGFAEQSHFSRVFKQTTGMSPLQFVTRERITRAQQLIRETKRSLIEIGLDVGYKNPSHFAQVFRRVVAVTPTEFRRAL